MSQTPLKFLVVNCTSTTIYDGNVTHTAGNQLPTSASIPADGLAVLQTTSITPFFPENGKKDKWSWLYRNIPNGPILKGSLDCEINSSKDPIVVVVLTDPGATIVRMTTKDSCHS